MPFIENVNTNASVWRNGTAYTIQSFSNDALLRILVHEMADKAIPSAVTYTGTGNGTIARMDCEVGGVTETWTITLTSATAFTVSGSVTGAIAGGTVGTNYDETKVKFLITAGGIAFISGDVFGFTQTANTITAANTWIIDQWDPFNTQGTGVGQALVWHGKGDGTEAIYCGARSLDDTPASKHNWEVFYATGHNASNPWSAQPGASPGRFVSWFDDDIRYWITYDSRRYIVTARVSDTHHSLYQGFFLPYGTPLEYPYPICCLAESDTSKAWSNTDADFNVPYMSDGGGYLRHIDGTNLLSSDMAGAAIFMTWPFGTMTGNPETLWLQNLSMDAGQHQLFPISLVKIEGTTKPSQIKPLGTLDGIRRITKGAGSETSLTLGGFDHIVFHNIEGEGAGDWWAQEMD